MAFVDASTGTTTLIYSHSVPYNATSEVVLPVNVTQQVNPGDQILWTLRATSSSSSNQWINLDDQQLSLTVVPAPASGGLTLAGLGGIVLVLRRRGSKATTN